MAKFKMEFEFDVHHHAPSAHLRFIESTLDQVRLYVGRGTDTEGDITTPAVGATREAVIGSWSFTEED